MTSGKMTVNEIILETAKKLKQAKIESANLDSRLLLCEFLGVDKVWLIVNSQKEIKNLEGFDELVLRRVAHEPMQYILNHAEFMGLGFYVDSNVLVPRPDTEVVVEKVIEYIGDKKAVFADLGTGSGCIPISILANCKNATGYAFDISAEALKIAHKNAESNKVEDRLEFVNMDILTDFPQMELDCIVSNPPYIESDVIPGLMEDVRAYEPKLALDGGEDGLVFYRRIAENGMNILKDGGLLAFEIGYNQAESVSHILKNKGYTNIEVTKDIAGNDRVVTAIK